MQNSLWTGKSGQARIPYEMAHDNRKDQWGPNLRQAATMHTSANSKNCRGKQGVRTVARRAALAMALAAAAWASMAAAGAKEAQAAPVKVAVQADKPDLVKGQRLWIQQKMPYFKREEWRVVGPEATFNDSGLCEVDLEPGAYVFSVMHVKDRRLVALRRGPVNVGDGTTVSLTSEATPRLITVAGPDGKPMPVMRMAVRLENTLVQTTWEEKNATPELIVSPSQDYCVRIEAAAKTPKLIFVALWKKLNASKPWNLSVKDPDVRQCQFTWPAPKGIKNARVTFFYPEAVLDVDGTATFVLMTNRRVMDFSYWYDLPGSGKPKHIQIRRRPLVMGGSAPPPAPEPSQTPTPAQAQPQTQTSKPPAETPSPVQTPTQAPSQTQTSTAAQPPVKMPPQLQMHVLGEPWEPGAWVGILYQLGQPYTRCFLTGVDLVNPSGDEIDGQANNWQTAYTIGFKMKAFLKNGKEAPQFLSVQDADKIGHPSNAILIDLVYNLTGLRKVRLKPSRFVTWKSEHFTITAPEVWEWRARSYLDRAERCREANQRVSDKTPPPHHDNSFWLTNGGNAYAGVGQGYMKMPIYGIRDDPTDLYAMPHRLFIHENLHNFGYTHGGEMNAVQAMAQGAFSEWRIYHADHPEYELTRVIKEGGGGGSSREVVKQPFPVPERTPGHKSLP